MSKQQSRNKTGTHNTRTTNRSSSFVPPQHFRPQDAVVFNNPLPTLESDDLNTILGKKRSRHTLNEGDTTTNARKKQKTNHAKTPPNNTSATPSQALIELKTNMIKQMDQIIQRTNTMDTQYIKQIKQLKAELQAEHKNKEMVRAKMKKLIDGNKVLMDKNVALNKALNEAKKGIEIARKDKDKWVKQMEQNINKMRQLEEENKSLKSTVSKHQSSLVKADVELAVVRTEKEKLIQEKQRMQVAMQKKIDALNVKSQKYNNMMKDMDALLKEDEGITIEENVELDRVFACVAQADKLRDIDDEILKEQCNERIKDVDEMEKEWVAWVDEMDMERKAHDMTKKKLKQKKRFIQHNVTPIIEKYMKKNKELTRKLTAKDDEILTLEMRNVTLENQMTEMRINGMQSEDENVNGETDKSEYTETDQENGDEPVSLLHPTK